MNGYFQYSTECLYNFGVNYKKKTMPAGGYEYMYLFTVSSKWKGCILHEMRIRLWQRDVNCINLMHWIGICVVCKLTGSCQRKYVSLGENFCWGGGGTYPLILSMIHIYRTFWIFQHPNSINFNLRSLYMHVMRR